MESIIHNITNGTKQPGGKYKVVEAEVPQNHKNLNFSMEYTINQLKVENYTITPDYDNENYQIVYEARNPDDLDRINGVVENEPYKIKVSIDNRDEETKEQIQSNAVYTIYEWDKTQNQYVEYISKINGQKVEMARGENKIYISNQWLYYTKNNEGNYKIVEQTAAHGYYGDYEAEGQKREYQFNLIDIINEGTYEGQGVGNESTINLRNNSETDTIENKRQKTKLTIQLTDKENKTETPQGNATLTGAEYEIYARTQINHADGKTTHYQGEEGVLYKQDERVKTVTTNENGSIVIEDLECGTYYVKQKTAPEGYLKDTNTYEIDLSYAGQEKVQIEVSQNYESTVKKQAFQILKKQYIGKEETSPLANAGFSIYLIKDLNIVKSGKISKNTDGSYTLNDEIAKKDERITKKANSKGNYKIGDLVDYYYKILYTEENMKQLPQGEKAYYPYDLTGEERVKNYADSQEGQEVPELITGSNGYLKSPELAYGEYIVIETSVPHNKEAVVPFTITVETDSREAQSLKYVVDPDFKTKIKIYTKDIETKETILKDNAKFVIKNVDTGKLVTCKGWNLIGGDVEYGTYEAPYQTSKKGYTITPMELTVGNYELIQLNAPEGYVLNGYEGHSENGEIIKTPEQSVTFEIGTNQMYYVDSELNSNIIVTVEENKAQVGTLEVNVKGEKLAQVDKHGKTEEPELTEDLEQETYDFQYTKEPLEGVQIGLYAKEDIYTQDEQKTKQYEKDQLIEIRYHKRRRKNTFR